MAIKKLGKAAAALALVVGLTAAMAGQASAAATVTWNGVRGLDSIGACAPGEAAEFHWILTPGGGNTVTSATLTFEGEDVRRNAVRQRCLALLHPRERGPGRGLGGGHAGTHRPQRAADDLPRVLR